MKPILTEPALPSATRLASKAALSASFRMQPRLGQEALAGRRQPDRAVAALQQRHTEDPFENLDLPAERRLRHVQSRRGAAEMQFLRHGHEAAHLAQLEHAAPSFSTATMPVTVRS